MPIAGAAIGAAVIGGGASVLASSKASKAATEAANSNNALQGQIYNSNTANLAPFMSRGNAAGDQINALLGLPNSSAAYTGGGYAPGSVGAQPFDQWAAYVDGSPDLAAKFAEQTGIARGRTKQEFGQLHYQQNGQSEGRVLPTTPQQQVQQQTATAQPGDPNAQNNAFQNYANSTGYQFQLGAGRDAITGSAATKGLLNSGSTLKALDKFGQNVGSTYFNNYLNALQGQQSTGLSGANALAGVGTNYAGQVGANNDSAASATGNAAISTANVFNGLLNNGVNALAYTGRGSSYGGSSSGLPKGWQQT